MSIQKTKQKQWLSMDIHSKVEDWVPLSKSQLYELLGDRSLTFLFVVHSDPEVYWPCPTQLLVLLVLCRVHTFSTMLTLQPCGQNSINTGISWWQCLPPDPGVQHLVSSCVGPGGGGGGSPGHKAPAQHQDSPWVSTNAGIILQGPPSLHPPTHHVFLEHCLLSEDKNIRQPQGKHRCQLTGAEL